MENILSKKIAATICALFFLGACHARDLRALPLANMENIKNLKISAVEGDASSSFKLSEYYGDHETFSFIDHYFFLRLAAEQGNCDAILSFRRLQKSQTMLDDFKVGENWRAAKGKCRNSPRVDKAPQDS